MSTIFSTIVQAFKTKLEQGPAVCANVYVARDRQVPDTVNEAIHIEFSSAVPRIGAIKGAPIDWITKVTVDCMARSKTLSGADAVDGLFKKVFERLASDTTLDNVVADIGYPVIESDYESNGQKTGLMRLTYQVEHRTTNSKLD